MAIISACQASSGSHAKQLPSKFDGIWRSNGYGYLIDARNGNVSAYNITPDSCLYDESIGEEFLAYANNDIANGKLRINADATRLYFFEPFEEYSITFNRQNHLPKLCDLHADNTPINTFNTFASYMSTHYAFFDLYNVNWAQVVEQARPKVSNNLSDKALFDLLSSMLEPLKDAHLSLHGEIDGKATTYKPERSTVGDATAKIAEEQNTTKSKIDQKFFKEYWLSDIYEHILSGDGEITANDWIQYGLTSEDIGYIAIATTYDYAGEGIHNPTNDQAVLSRTLDRAITLFNNQQVKAVVLDLSINFGGHSFPATDIAARFTQEKVWGFSKRAYDAVGLDDTPIYISPSNKPSYRGPVYILAANTTVSGGEELVLALRAIPKVTFVGERTRGALSDILDKSLPNSWTLSLSNEIYTDPQGIRWEGDGIQPDIEVTIFNKENPFKGHLEAVNTVIQRIDNKH